MTEPRKSFPFKNALVALGVTFPLVGWVSEHRRAERLEKKLFEYEPPHKLPPCQSWIERMTDEKEYDPPGRE
jgi:hypothetical protein